MTREEIQQHLEQGGFVIVDNIWCFTKHTMHCNNPGCCDDDFLSSEEATSSVARLARRDLSDVVLEKDDG